METRVPAEGGGSESGRIPSSGGPLLGVRVLVVDDNESHRELLGLLLGGWGCVVDTAGDGVEALRAMDTAAKSGAPYELLLVDSSMPGMSGSDLLRRTQDAPGRRVLVTPLVDRLGPDELSELGVSATVTKPIRHRHLYDTIAAVVRGEEPTRSATTKERHTRMDNRCAGLRVLVVDDNPVNRRVAVAYLDQLGCSSGTADNGLNALELLTEPGQHFDLVLMDCQMPLMDGYAATRELRDHERLTGGQALPVVAVTANGLGEERQRCRDAGMDGYLTKPFKVADLAEVIVSHAVKPAGTPGAPACLGAAPAVGCPVRPGGS